MIDERTVMSLLRELAQDNWVLNFNDNDVKKTAKAALELLEKQKQRIEHLETMIVTAINNASKDREKQLPTIPYDMKWNPDCEDCLPEGIDDCIECHKRNEGQ